MIRCIIVDDEAPARSILREFLETDDRFDIVAECVNGFEAVKRITEIAPDLIFLDISMPKLDGFEVLELLDRKPHVVFVTAHDEHAVRAFEVHAVDYLLKPFSQERFAKVLARVVVVMAARESQPIEKVAESARNGRTLQRILVRNGGDIEVLPLVKIDYIEAQDDYVVIAAAGKKHKKQQTLSELELQIDNRRFIRVHRSYLVNIDRLSKVEAYGKDSKIAILLDGTKIPISKSGYAKLKELL